MAHYTPVKISRQQTVAIIEFSSRILLMQNGIETWIYMNRLENDKQMWRAKIYIVNAEREMMKTYFLNWNTNQN